MRPANEYDPAVKFIADFYNVSEADAVDLYKDEIDAYLGLLEMGWDDDEDE
jgi:hypothetical protein